MEAYISASEATSAAWDEHACKFKEQVELLKGVGEKLAQAYDNLKEERDSLARENDGDRASEADLLEINAGGRIVSVTRRTLTQIKGSRLEAIFSGRWEKELLRDKDGRIFLDVNSDCFQALVDFLNQRRITPPEEDIDPPFAGEENKNYIDCLLLCFGIEKLVSSAPRQMEERSKEDVLVEDWESLTFDEFSGEFKRHLKSEQQALIAAKKDLSEQEHSFKQEKQALSCFMGGKQGDIVWLNVSGVHMAVKRSTLGIFKDSVLSKQFDDPSWEQEVKDSQATVEKWTPKMVEAWANSIKGVTKETAGKLLYNEVNGINLLAMKWEHFKNLKIKAGEVAIITSEIEVLRQSCKPSPVFVEHSAYCFGKVIDQLRIAAMQQLLDTPLPAPQVRSYERKRFKTIVEYYFPGESADFIMGKEAKKAMETNILNPSHVGQLFTWLADDSIGSNLELIYRASCDGWEANIFHSKCDKKKNTVSLVRSTCGYIFGGFADESWASSGGYKASPRAFLFGMRTHTSDQPSKFRLKIAEDSNATYHASNWGPVFGGGSGDICISNHPNTNSSWAYLGHTFHSPSGQVDPNYFTGSESFSVAELEVFHVT